MLLDKQRGGHEHGHLLAVLHGLEGGTQCDFGFAEAHVAADEAVHRHGLFHVGFNFVDGGELVGGFLIGEGVFQLFLPWGVRAEREALGALAGGVQLDQVVGDLVDVLAGLGLGGRPVGAAELVELGASAPMYLLTWSSWSVGMNSLSAGAPRLEGAYSMTRYSRVVLLAPVPMVR